MRCTAGELLSRWQGALRRSVRASRLLPQQQHRRSKSDKQPASQPLLRPPDRPPVPTPIPRAVRTTGARGRSFSENSLLGASSLELSQAWRRSGWISWGAKPCWRGDGGGYAKLDRLLRIADIFGSAKRTTADGGLLPLRTADIQPLLAHSERSPPARTSVGSLRWPQPLVGAGPEFSDASGLVHPPSRHR